MDAKEMRTALQEAGRDVPRSNDDVEAAYARMIDSAPEPEQDDAEGEAVPPKENIFTYIGAGETPPHMINFMGLQRFVRGQAVEVTNPIVLRKVETHRCFVAGEIDSDEMFEQDDLAKKRADKQRMDDAELQAEAESQNSSKK